MAVDRIRKADSEREMDKVVDDFVTQGYEVQERGERSTLLRQKSWGSGGWHVIVFIATVWWTLGIGNLVYALIARYATADQVMVRVDEGESS